MLILRYTPALQKALGLRLKAEPWLHIAIHTIQPSLYGHLGKQDWTFWYAIYVWDTRQVVDDGTVSANLTTAQVDKIRSAKEAIDNHQPLVDGGGEAKEINQWFSKHGSSNVGTEAQSDKAEKTKQLRDKAMKDLGNKLSSAVSSILTMAPDAYVDVMRKSDWHKLLDDALGYTKYRYV